MHTYNDPLSKKVIEWVSKYPLNHMWTLPELIGLIKRIGAINPYLNLLSYRLEQEKFINKYFVKYTYWHLNDDVKDCVSLYLEPDPVWREHLALTKDIRENLYFTPFMVKCDDRDFLIGALETALAEVKEPNWFDWYVELLEEGDDEGDYYEIKRFEEEG